MPIHLNPFRLYKNNLCLNHGLLVDILRNSQIFWEAYGELLSIAGKRESDERELKVLMSKMSLAPKQRKVSEKDAKKIVARVEQEFDSSIAKIDEMFDSLKVIIIDDATFFYRAVERLEVLHRRVGRLRHIPEWMRLNIQNQIYSLVAHMAEKQQHAWHISKGHSRGFTKIDDLTIVTTRGERRRLRHNVLEMDHIDGKIKPLMEHVWALSKSTSHEHIHTLHSEMVSLLQLYQQEITDLADITHEADVLVRRTENLFKAIEREAGSLGIPALKGKAAHHGKKFNSLMLKIESQARREYFDINHILNSLPKPQKVSVANQPQQPAAKAA
jgi:hypothetical protein